MDWKDRICPSTTKRLMSSVSCYLGEPPAHNESSTTHKRYPTIKHATKYCRKIEKTFCKRPENWFPPTFVQQQDGSMSSEESKIPLKSFFLLFDALFSLQATILSTSIKCGNCTWVVFIICDIWCHFNKNCPCDVTIKHRCPDVLATWFCQYIRMHL